MTSLFQSAVPLSAPAPVLPLSYSKRTDRFPILVGVGALFSIVALLMRVLLSEVHPNQVAEPYYAAIVMDILPRLELMMIGAGMALTCVGRRFAPQCSRIGFWCAIAISLLVLAMEAVNQVMPASKAPVRWVSLNACNGG
jgi:hypothetical protein